MSLEQKNAKINSQEKFQASRTAKICSRKPKKKTSPIRKIKLPQNFHTARYAKYVILRGGGGGHSLIWPIRGRAAGQGMVFVLSALNIGCVADNLNYRYRQNQD